VRQVIVADEVSSDYAAAVQKRMRARFHCDSTGERYPSSSGGRVLELTTSHESPNGPRIFDAAVLNESGQCRKLGSAAFLSAGCAGFGFDHWSGDPWKPDSSGFVLTHVEKSGQSELQFFDAEGARFQPTIKQATHVMWSANGIYYLYRTSDSFRVIRSTNFEIVLSTPVADYCHNCFLIGDDGFICIGTTAKFVSLNSGEIAELGLPRTVGRNDYCLYDRETRSVLVAFDYSMLDFITSDRWIAIKVE
jgi:hypothetical protein